MNAIGLGLLTALVAYLIGAIPFGYLVARGLKGIDIRTVGSGNIGATNVGRALGFRYFLLVFAFDLFKGWFPAWGAPHAVSAWSGSAPGWVGVAAALASILGHNFPVYLRFKGGKGVATSLGAMFALDPIASLAAAGGFLLALLACRFVSVSSIVGGLVFAVTHFVLTASPWAPEHRAMSILTVGLLVLLVSRHRGNLARVRAGTEPKVGTGRRKKSPEGKAAIVWVGVLAALSLVALGGYTLVARSLPSKSLVVSGYRLEAVDRASTGHQRAERLTFLDGGRLLAVTCPRYHRLVFYRVTESDTLEPLRDIELSGKPVALWPASDRLHVLERPPGDHRHVEPGWWEAFDFQGNRLGERVHVGFYPDDFAIAPDGRHAFVVCSGRAEGGSERPSPGLDVFAIEPGSPPARSRRSPSTARGTTPPG